MIDREWLESINEELSRENVPIHQRDVKAVLKWQRDTGERKDIFEGYPEVYGFFAAMSSPQNPFAEFRGAFFFGGEFWPLTFPMTFGAVPINIDYVIAAMGMPQPEAKRLLADEQSRYEAASVIGNCLDWINGFPRVGSANQLTFADKNLSAADRHLRGAVETLLSGRGHSRGASMILSAHALENVLKAFLAHHARLDDRQAKVLNHDLGKILRKVLATPNSSDLTPLQERLKVYPNVIQDRYRQVDYPETQLWEAYRWASSEPPLWREALTPGLNMSDAVLNAFALSRN